MRKQADELLFFNDTATTEIYTLSLHDALPIFPGAGATPCLNGARAARGGSSRRTRSASSSARSSLPASSARPSDRKSTRLNSSHANISYAVFCLKKKKNNHQCMSPLTSSSDSK